MNEKNIELFLELCNCFAPSGCESAVLDIIEKEMKEVTCSCYRDKLGNLIAIKHSKTVSTKPPIMLCTHVDEASFMINSISSDGYIYFAPLCKIDPRTLCGKNVLVGTSDRVTKGIISSKAIHHQTAEERKKSTPVDKMYVDIGASSNEDTKFKADIGDYIVFDSQVVPFGDKYNLYRGKSVDSRISAMALIGVAKLLENTDCDVCFAFVTRGNLGLSAVSSAVHSVRPKYLYVVNTIESSDYYPLKEKNERIRLGSGPVLTFADKRAAYDYELTKDIETIAKVNDISLQINPETYGDVSDAAKAQISAGGAKCVSVSLPSRYRSTANPVVSLDDCDSLVRLLKVCIDSISN